MEINIITDFADLEQIKDNWENLSENLKNPSFYDSYVYCTNTCKKEAIGQNSTLFIICLYEKKELIGIAPMMIKKNKNKLFSFKVLRFITSGDFLNFLINKNVNENAVIKQIFKVINSNDSWDRIVLTGMSQNSSLTHFLLKSEEYRKYVSFSGENPIIKLKSFANFEHYKKIFLRKNINYYINKLKKDHRSYFEIIQGNDHKTLSQISKVHKARHGNTKGRYWIFTKDNLGFLENLYNSGNSITFLLKSYKNEIISYATCYKYKNEIVHCWNMAYNPIFNNYSPGDLIFYEMIKYLFKVSPNITLDLGAGAYPWKFRLTNDFIGTYDFIYNSKKSQKQFLLKKYDLFNELKKALS